MCQSPALLQALIRDRMVDVQQSAEVSIRSRPRGRRRAVIEAARTGAGWLLVDLGPRRAVPRHREPSGGAR